MIVFFLVATLLVVVALLFVVLPLIGRRSRKIDDVSHSATNLSIYKDQLRELEADLVNGAIDQLQYDAAKREVERRALEEVEQDADEREIARGPQWGIAIALAVAIPVSAVGLYTQLGNPTALSGSKESITASGDGGHSLSPEQIAGMVDQLKARLNANPQDVDGWVMLAKTTSALGRFDDAVGAYRKLVEIVPNDAQLLADFADALAVSQGRLLTGEPEQLIKRALQIDAKNIKALALAGTMDFQNARYASAADHWRRILAVIPPDSPFADQIRGSIAEAESKSKGATGKLAGAGAKDEPQRAEAGSNKNVSGRVVLSKEAKEASSSTDTVFVFARPVDGTRMPLAVKKMLAADLPANFELTEAMAMSPDASLAKHAEVYVSARLSKSGAALPSKGDWESAPVKVRTGAAGISLSITRPVS